MQHRTSDSEGLKRVRLCLYLAQWARRPMPTIREVARWCGIPSSTVHDYLGVLEDAGEITIERATSRGVRLANTSPSPP